MTSLSSNWRRFAERIRCSLMRLRTSWTRLAREADLSTRLTKSGSVWAEKLELEAALSEAEGALEQEENKVLRA